MSISKLTREQSNELYRQVVADNDFQTMRRLCLEDLFFLLCFACKRKDINRDWLYERVREVEASPDNHLDLWAREHYKSTIITFGLTIQELLRNPELTFGIFSHTRPIAKAFLSQIKRELETNVFLQDLFPDVLYKEPHKESPLWSLDSGITVKRKSNPKEATIEAWGLVDGQPTSKHYSRLIYDDVVTRESVTTPEMIAKVTEAFSLSLNLAGQDCKKRYIGTRYHVHDTYKVIIDRGTAKPRIYPATHDGTINGRPVLLSQGNLDEKLRDMGSYVFGSQMLQNPLADNAMGFKHDWLMYYNNLRNSEKWNYYAIVDPASKKKKKSDYTMMAVIGLAPDNNYYLVDGCRDKMNLTERTNKLFAFHRKWHPINIGYEEYGLQADIEHIQFVQELEGYRFPIIPLGGSMAKEDRIRMLVPIFENRRFYIPYKLLFKSSDDKLVDLIKVLIEEEYDCFPVCAHDDGLDCIARILQDELGAVFPKISEDIPVAMPSSNEPFDPFNLNRNLVSPFAR